jgi:hypothetical protein
MKLRSRTGSIAAEHMAALIILVLGLFFPLCNIAASAYRYTIALQSVHNGAYAGSVANSFTAGSDPKGNDVQDIVPNTINTFLNANTGVHNATVKYRLLETDINTKAVTPFAFGAKLPYDPKAGCIYSIECDVACDIDPLVPFNGPLVPHVPGMTSAFHTQMSAKQLIENPTGMTK